MLVITRKAEEGLVIGDNIRITIAEIGKDRVKLGIEAPADVKIARNELYATEQFNQQAASGRLSVEMLTRMVNGGVENNDK